jgi:hypothetical protein
VSELAVPRDPDAEAAVAPVLATETRTPDGYAR